MVLETQGWVAGGSAKTTFVNSYYEIYEEGGKDILHAHYTANAWLDKSFDSKVELKRFSMNIERMYGGCSALRVYFFDGDTNVLTVNLHADCTVDTIHYKLSVSQFGETLVSNQNVTSSGRCMLTTSGLLEITNAVTYQDVIYTYIEKVVFDKVRILVGNNCFDGRNDAWATISNVTLETGAVTPTYNITIRVIDSVDKSPVEGVTVTVDNIVSATTDAYGDVVFYLDEGYYIVELVKDGFKTVYYDMSVTKDETFLFEITPEVAPAPPTYIITVIVKDKLSSAVISGASVSINGVSDVTDGGQVALSVEEGVYSLSVSKDGYYDYSSTITVTNDETIVVELEPLPAPVTPTPTPTPAPTKPKISLATIGIVVGFILIMTTLRR